MVQRAVRVAFWWRITALSAVLLGLHAFAAPAHARVFFGIGFPFYFGPPAYYPPPIDYPVQPVSYAPRSPQPAAPSGQSCYLSDDRAHVPGWAS